MNKVVAKEKIVIVEVGWHNCITFLAMKFNSHSDSLPKSIKFKEY